MMFMMKIIQHLVKLIHLYALNVSFMDSFYLISWALVLIPLKHCNVMFVEVHVTLEIYF